MTAPDQLVLVQVLCIALLARRITDLETRLAVARARNQLLKGGAS